MEKEIRKLITVQEVIKYAFSSFSQITPDIINETKIVAAQEQYIRPVFNELYVAMIDGKYTELVNTFIKPALAYYVRYGVLPDISVQMGNNGLQTSYTAHTNAASDKQRETLRMQAMSDANSLLDVAVRYVESNKDLFSEYAPRENARHKTKIAGGIIL